MVAEDDEEGRAGGAAGGELAHGAEHVVEREAVLGAHPVVVAPDDLGRVAGGGVGVEDPAVAEGVPGEDAAGSASRARARR